MLIDKVYNAVRKIVAPTIIRIEAIKCLGLRREKKAKKIIRQIAEFETHANIRLGAIQAMARYRDPDSAAIFSKCLDDEDWLIREESIKGLLSIDDKSIQQISIPYVIKALNDSRINVRLAALEHLAVKDKRLFKELTAIINDNDNYYRINLIKACLKAIQGYLLDEKTRNRLIEFLPKRICLP